MVHRLHIWSYGTFIFYLGVMELWNYVSSPSFSHLQLHGIQKFITSATNISQVNFYPFPNQYHILRF